MCVLDNGFAGSFSIDPNVRYAQYPTLALPAEDETIVDDEVLETRWRVQDELEERVECIFAMQ